LAPVTIATFPVKSEIPVAIFHFYARSLEVIDPLPKFRGIATHRASDIVAGHVDRVCQMVWNGQECGMVILCLHPLKQRNEEKKTRLRIVRVFRNVRCSSAINLLNSIGDE
jgi:hypothetical protein